MENVFLNMVMNMKKIVSDQQEITMMILLKNVSKMILLNNFLNMMNNNNMD